MDVLIKICGITSLEDALAALEAGVDFLGYNFYPASPRFIPPPECSRIQSSLDSRGIRARTVGIFVNTKTSEILETMDSCGLDLAQLSGDETVEALLGLSGRGYKAIRPQSEAQAWVMAREYAVQDGQPVMGPALHPFPALLVDAFHPGQYGGTGLVGDWSLAAGLSAQYPIFLAGGLRPDNVSQALAQVCPWGVDVASGVESAPGVKDRAKLAAFVKAVREFEQETMR